MTASVSLYLSLADIFICRDVLLALSALLKSDSAGTGTGTLTQTLSVCPSTSYTLSFTTGDYAGSGCNLRVTLGGQSRWSTHQPRSLLTPQPCLSVDCF